MRRRCLVTGAWLLLLALPGCRSPQQKAAAADAAFDQYYAAGDLPHARAAIQIALKNNQDEPSYWAKLGRVALQSGDAAGAYSAYGHVLDLQRDNVEALEWMSTLAVAGGDEQNAKTYLDTLMVLQPNDVRGRLAQGALAIRQGHFPQAATLADQILADVPDEPEAINLKASALEKQGRVRDAIAILETRLKAGPVELLLRHLLALYKAAGDKAGAETTYARLFALKPDDVGLQVDYARVLYDRGDIAQALALIRKVQATHRSDTGVQLAAIHFYADTQGSAAAAQELEALASHGTPGLKVALANYLLGQHEAASARALVEPLVRDQEVTAANVNAQVIYAGALAQLGEVGPALGVLDHILKFDSSSSRALLIRAGLEISAGKLNEALSDARVLVAENPDSEDAALMLARVYEARGDQPLARQAFLSARNAHPASLQASEQLTDYLLDQHDDQGALDATQALVTTSPRVPAAWLLRGQACLRASDNGCVVQALGVLGALSNGAAAKQALAQAVALQQRERQLLPADLAGALNNIMNGTLPFDGVVDALVQAKRVADARAIVGQVVRRQPANVHAQVVQARLLMVSGEEANGRALLLRLLARDPRQPEAVLVLSSSLFRAGDRAGALATLGRGLQAMPNNLDLLRAQGGLQIAANQPAAALASYRRVLALAPGDLTAVNNYAALLADLARSPADAAEAVRVSAPLARQDSAPTNDTRGWALLRAGRQAEALPLLRRALSQDPNGAIYSYHLGVATLAAGDRTSGRRLIQAALAHAGRGDNWVPAARAALGAS